MPAEYLSYILWTLATLLAAIGFLGCILPYPGHLFLMVAVGLIGYDKGVEWWVYLICGLLAVSGMFIDTIFTYYGCKKFGSSKRGLWCSMVGLLIGSFFFPIGLLIGPFAGAFLAEYLWVRRSLKESGTSGVGALVGFIAGTLAKAVIGIVMCLIVLAA